MAKRLIDINEQIQSDEKMFKTHLESSLDSKVYHFINMLSENVQVYIFSGVIRDYFLKIKEHRDVDLVLNGDFNIENVLEKYVYRKNSFGGYKITINDTSIDLWFLKDTWALKNHQSTLEFEIEKYIPRTAFFNFSSIIFSFNDSKFYPTKYFKRFLRDKKIDLVFRPNANYALCIINSFYYSDKLNLQIAENLRKYLVLLHKGNSKNYEEIQLKHFGKIIYSEKEIDDRILMLKS